MKSAQAKPQNPLVLASSSEEGITTILINRPEVRNAVNHATSLELAAAFSAFEEDKTQKVCVFSGVGGTFCAGYDLHEVAAGRSEVGQPSPSNLGPMGPSRMQLTKPVIAAISGHAVAGGLELSLLADIRVVDTTAVFGVFCRRFGVPLIDGGTIRLQRVVGLGRAMDMILTGRPVDANEALSFGLATRVVEQGRALENAMELARSLLQFPFGCMRADLVSTQYSAYSARDFQDAIDFEFTGGCKVLQDESVQGATKFHKGEGRGGQFGPSKL